MTEGPSILRGRQNVPARRFRAVSISRGSLHLAHHTKLPYRGFVSSGREAVDAVYIITQPVQLEVLAIFSYLCNPILVELVAVVLPFLFVCALVCNFANLLSATSSTPLGVAYMFSTH